MEYEEIEIKDKPKDWPANSIESQIENLNNQLEKFIDNPTYKNKEVLISLISYYDLNQHSHIGLHRTTAYEVAQINSLFVYASFIYISSLKTYLYELVGEKTRMQKMISWFPNIEQSIEIKEFSGLIPQLKLYHIAYQSFNVDKDMSFAEKLIETVEYLVDYFKENESEEIYKQQLDNITRSYINIINDISYFRCLKRTGIWAFSRNEIYKVFQLASKLSKLNGDNPIERPLKGVLMTSISNYILKSRNNYNEDYICKYISKEVAELSVYNHEIWMQNIKNLNDEREQKVISEMFEEEGWNDYLWAKDLNFEAKRNYFVSCFCKSINDERMQQDYGSCLYGYKNDRMADILAPIYTWGDENKKPFFSQVLTFDVLYDRDEAKKEINFLCKIIENFDMSESDKKDFLEDILQYWILSVKDNKWAHERERRYVLFMYENYEYKEVDMSDKRFLKIKNSIFIQPDFILGNNPVKNYLRDTVNNKRHAISMRPYLFCSDCFNRDFDSATTGISKGEKCSICGSKNISYETPDRQV